MSSPFTQKKALVILADGFEEIETVTPIDLLRRAGAQVTLAVTGSLPPSGLVKGRCGVAIQAEVSLDKISVDALAFDLLLIPGGPAVMALRKDRRVREWVVAFAQSQRWIGAICAAPLVLHDVGALAGRRFTAYATTRDEMPAALTGERVVRDANIITSRSAGTALDFALELVRALYGDDATRKLFSEILA
ncbi:MAG: DJ-1/PfpI family protein [Puniceicoccales bacterium]|nr:DJ-1/PfpI family protein [Puniceicoccales bacterium]